MKKNVLQGIIFVFIFSMFSIVFGQSRTLDPDEGFVNEIIDADTLSDGSQVDSIYIFKRDATYYLRGDIKNVGYTLTLKAEDGDGALPILRNWPDADGDLNRMVTASDDAYIYNLYIDGMGPDTETKEPDASYLMNGQLLRANAAGKVLVIDGCILANSGQTIIRSNSGAQKVQVTNTIIANCGQLSRDNLGNGRIIDFRSGITDTCIFRNCTMVNTYDRLIRHYGAAASTETAYIDYFEMDHNTIIHNTGAYGFIFLGDISSGVKITNNLFYNPMTLGVDTSDTQRFAEISNISEVGEDGVYEFPLIIEQPNDLYKPYYEMDHNVIVYDDTIKSYFSTNGVSAAEPLATRLAAEVTGTTPFTESTVTLTNIPNNLLNVMNWYRPLALDTLGGGMITTSDVDMDRRDFDYWLNDFDASYTTDDEAFVGTDDLPVGADWNSTVTDVKSDEDILPNQFSLSQNYPNPFNPTTTIKYTIPESGMVTMKVYNILGQEVATLVNEQQISGSYMVSFDASGLASGLYIYKIKTGSFMQCKKMMLLK